MAYGFNPNVPQPTNNLWVGNNYSGYSANRSNMYPAAQYPQPAPSLSQMPPATMNNILTAMGPESAKGFRVGPNSHVILMDTERPVFYMKRSDDTGYDTVRAFKFEEIPIDSIIQAENVVVTDNSHSEPTLYATKEDLTDLKQEFCEFKKMMEDLVMKNA